MTQENKDIIEKALIYRFRNIINPCDDIIQLVFEKPNVIRQKNRIAKLEVLLQGKTLYPIMSERDRQNLFILKMKNLPYKERIETLVWIIDNCKKKFNLEISDIKGALVPFHQDLRDIFDINSDRKWIEKLNDRKI